jgi:hypothetical protein
MGTDGLRRGTESGGLTRLARDALWGTEGLCATGSAAIDLWRAPRPGVRRSDSAGTEARPDGPDSTGPGSPSRGLGACCLSRCVSGSREGNHISGRWISRHAAPRAVRVNPSWTLEHLARSSEELEPEHQKAQEGEQSSVGD